MTVKELANKKVVISAEKEIRLGDYYSDVYLEEFIDPDEEYSDEEVLNNIIDDMQQTIYDFIDLDDISIKWKS